jgi:GNAT superfamily N-acetyltransferase
MSLSIFPAQPSDLDTVLDLYDEGARWLAEQGLRAGPYPQPVWVRQGVAADIAAGCVYLAREPEGPVLGTVRLLWSDPDLWPPDKDEAGYVHGLIIRNEARGRGLGVALLAWAEQTVRARGRRYLRLDCDARNPKLCAYYERLGFKPAGVIPTARHMAARYEKDL